MGLCAVPGVFATLAARGESPAAFGRRCIPADCVAPPSNIPDILGRRALSSGRLAALGATPDFHHGLLGLIAADTVRSTADLVANEVTRLLSGATVHDRATGVVRAAQPADVAILFRSRDSHREFEAALDRAGIPTYVYKGLGF